MKALGAYFTKEQIVDLTSIISLMNALNRVAVGFRHMPEPRT